MQKSEVADVIKSIFQMWSNTTSHSAKRLYTDNGGEYVTSELQSFLREQGVIVCLDTNIFLFLLSIFLDLIFLFLFIFLDNKEACDHCFLFLLPPSCMVAPIGEIANKFNFTTSFSTTIQSNNQ